MVFHKILIVEDDTSLALSMKDYFEDNDFEVIHVVSGEEAVEVFEKKRPSIVLLDVQLPGIDGFEVLSKIKKMDNSIPVLMMTEAKYDADSQKRGYDLRADIYMPKPVFPESLLSKINNLLNPPETKIYLLGNYRITIQNNELSINDEICTLKENDIQVLSVLLLKQNTIVLRKDLLLSVWKSDDMRFENQLDSSISRIKKSLKKYPDIIIKNIYGKGYSISTNRLLHNVNNSIYTTFRY